MFAAGTATEVLPGNKNLTFISILVQYKVGIRVTGFVITPVAEKIIAEALACGCFQEAGRDDLVSRGRGTQVDVTIVNFSFISFS